MPLRQLWGPASTGVVLAQACAASVGRDCMQWICVLGGVFVALEAQRSGWAMASCLFVASVGLAMLWAGWRLATETASALLHAGSESP